MADRRNNFGEGTYLFTLRIVATELPVFFDWGADSREIAERTGAEVL